MVNKIGWCDKTLNPVVGCPHNCSYCYARRQAKRFLHRCKLCYDFVPHPHLERLSQLTPRQKPKRIFMDSMWDWNAEGVLDEWIYPQIAKMEECKQHTFPILSKRPIRYSRFTYPENVWLGTSLCDWRDTYVIHDLDKAVHDNVKFLSIEPIHGPVNFWFSPPTPRNSDGVSWVIIGAETGHRKDKVAPQKAWVDPVIENCRAEGIPVFVKNSLIELWGEDYRIQEFPEVVK
jgi:protein gp37